MLIIKDLNILIIIFNIAFRIWLYTWDSIFFSKFVKNLIAKTDFPLY